MTETYTAKLVTVLCSKPTKADLVEVSETLAREADEWRQECDEWKEAAGRWELVAKELTDLVRQINKDNSGHVERMAKLLPYGACGDEPETPTGTVH
jgi:hypothetical protein